MTPRNAGIYGFASLVFFLCAGRAVCAAQFSYPSAHISSDDMFGPSDAVDVLQGVNIGFRVYKSKIKVYDYCVHQNDEDEIPIATKAALALFKTLTKENALQGLRELSKVMDSARAAFKRCRAPAEYLQSFDSAIAMIRNQNRFEYTPDKHILINDNDITYDVADMMLNWSDHDYKDFGFFLGRICFRASKIRALRGEATVRVEQPPAVLVA